jgi:hypothetical protein
MDLLPFFEWMESTAITKTIQQSDYINAMANVLHLLSLTIFAGAVLVVDLRLLGGGMREQPLAQVARDAQPWLVGGFLGMLATGLPQLFATPIKEYYSPYFWFKMQVLVVALIFTFTLRRKVTQGDEARLGPVWGKLVALASLALWTTVAVSGRLIGLLT